ncbi:MAG: dienelactone hydrolase family protein [Steroidobacteraceae bacterium]|nr:dienelactone hydrolase family protein [Steroidobacteraceae bacterium]MDW8259356.1 dienelactone hydrolase family protein [Gammaproteobacteria bacterium]
MGEMTTLMARDGHEFQAYLCAPKGSARGAILVQQEVFGVNQHIREVADGFAAEGYLTIAPSMFDRIRRGIQLGYTPAEIQEGIGYMMQTTKEQALANMAAAINVVKHAGKVGVVGYCWGGLCAYWAACELPVAAAVCYYGGGIHNHLDKTPKVPTMYHYGEKDSYIPLSDVEKVKQAHPAGTFYLYSANHGFNCNMRGDYHPESAALARKRTLEFFAEHVAAQA